MSRFLFTILIVLAPFVLRSQVRSDLIPVTYICYNKPLKIVLQDLTDLTKINIVYSDTKLPTNKLIQVNAKNQPIGAVLNYILNPLHYKYKIIANQLVIVKIGSAADKEFTLSGYIKDKNSNEPLIGANIYEIEKKYGTNTNEQGFFTLKMPSETQRLVITYLGYKSENFDITLLRDSTLNVYLVSDLKLNEVLITDKSIELEKEYVINKQAVNVELLRNSNSLGGESDLFRYLASVPGVTSAADGIGGINVRGSSADNNLILLDGAPLYNIGHGLGIFSTVNPNIIKRADFYKGSMPARYSGRLASVLDLHTRQGNSNKISGEAAFSLISFKASLEGPIVKEKGSFMVSYRRTFIDIWLKEISRWLNNELDRSGESNYFFSDIYAKANYQLTSKHKAEISFFRSRDEFTNLVEKDKDGILLDLKENNINWGNDLMSLKFTSEWGKNLFGKLLLYQSLYDQNSFKYSAYNNINTTTPLDYINAYLFTSKVQERAGKYEFDWLPSKKQYVKMGISYTSRVFSPKVLEANEKDLPANIDMVTSIDLDTLGVNANIKSHELNVYIEDDIKVTDGFRANIGVNYANFMDSLFSYNAIQPRLGLLFGSDKTALKFGFGKTIQYLHLISSSGLGLYNDVWLPSQKKMSPQSAWIGDASFTFKTNSGYKFGIEFYYKWMHDLSNFPEGKTTKIEDGVDWVSEIVSGKGKAYGAEVFLEKNIGKLIGSVSYTYSKSRREFELLNNGHEYPFTYNRDHSIKTNLVFKISQFSEFTASWNWLSGTFYSKPLSYTTLGPSGPIVIFTEKNNTRFDPYQRLDLGFVIYNSFRWGSSKLFLGAYNVINNKNYFYADIERDNTDLNKFTLQYFRLLPLIPSISFSIAW